MARPRILLTGGSGFIGGNLLKSPLGDRFDLEAPSRAELDLLDTDAVDAYFAERRFDAVVHAAGKPGHRNAPDRDALFYSNVRQYMNLARHASAVGRMVVLGSGAVYGMEHYRPRMAEDTFGRHVPADEHGFCRYVCGLHAEASANIYDLRLFGVFGPGEDYAIRFISNLMCKCLLGLPLTMNQDRVFHYLDVADLAPILGDFLELPRPGFHAYNVVPDEAVSLLDLAHRIRDIAGRPDLPIVVRLPGRGAEYTGDNARLRRELPGLRITPLGDSLARLYAWYRARIHLIRREELLHDK